MQWSAATNAGFSNCKPKQLVRPLAKCDIGGYETTNVDAERADDDSLLAWFERMLRTLRECPSSAPHRGGCSTPAILVCSPCCTRVPRDVSSP